MIVLQIVILIILIYIIFLLSYSMLRGAPYAGLSNNRIKTMFELLNVEKGKKFLDLGSGDGRLVIYASNLSLESYGYEINPLFVVISKFNTRRKKSKSKIQLKNYWRENLSKFDYITIWGVPPMMSRLEKKLLKELRPGARVVSNHLAFPNWKPKQIENDVYLYVKS